MTRNLEKQVALFVKKERYDRLVEKNRQIRLEKMLWTGTTLLLATVLGFLLILS